MLGTDDCHVGDRRAVRQPHLLDRRRHTLLYGRKMGPALQGSGESLSIPLTDGYRGATENNVAVYKEAEIAWETAAQKRNQPGNLTLSDFGVLRCFRLLPETGCFRLHGTPNQLRRVALASAPELQDSSAVAARRLWPSADWGIRNVGIQKLKVGVKVPVGQNTPQH